MTWENYLVNRVSEVLNEPPDNFRLEKHNASRIVLRPNYICIFYTEDKIVIGLHPKTQHLLNEFSEEKDIENYIENKLFLRLGYVQRELHPPFNQTYWTTNDNLSLLENNPKLVKRFRRNAKRNIKVLAREAFMLDYTNNLKKVLITNAELLIMNLRTNFLDVYDYRYHFYKNIKNILSKNISVHGLFIVYNKSIKDEVCFTTIDDKIYLGIKDSILDEILTVPESLDDILLHVINNPIRDIRSCK